MSTDLYNELAFYTLSHPDSYFIHQNVVDAYTAQTANSDTKKIAVFFALAGLYLTLEKGFTGREVQLAHIKMTKNKKDIPHIHLPQDKGLITIRDVLNIPPGKERDIEIKKWCASVWEAYSSQRDIVIASTESSVK